LKRCLGVKGAEIQSSSGEAALPTFYRLKKSQLADQLKSNTTQKLE